MLLALVVALVVMVVFLLSSVVSNGGGGFWAALWAWVEPRGITSFELERCAINLTWRPFSDDRFPENAGPSRMLQSNTSGCTLRGRGGTTSTVQTLQPWEMRPAGLIRVGRRRILGRARASPAG